MGYECNELNFVMMHTEAVFQVSSKSNLPTALHMMKINKVVKKQKAQSEEENYMTPINVDDGPSSSHPPLSPGASPKMSHQKSKPQTNKQTTRVEMVSVSTQTGKEMVSVNLAADEDELNMFDLKAMRQNYLVTTIQQQDFQE